MGDGENDILYELPFKLDDQRDLAVESMYEYGTRAGIWRLFRVFDAAGIPVTFFAAAVALERNPEVAKKLAARGDEAAGHGFRWSNHFEMTRDEEREAIKRAIESIERTTGTRPLGWYCREMSVNTRELVVEEGGFVYDSDCYSDDLPYWTRVARQAAPGGAVRAGRQRRALRPGAGLLGSPDDFFETAKAHLDRLRNDGDDVNRMMSIGLHPRITGNPAGPTRSRASSSTGSRSATCGSRAASTSRRRSSSSSRARSGCDVARRPGGAIVRLRTMPRTSNDRRDGRSASSSR